MRSRTHADGTYLKLGGMRLVPSRSPVRAGRRRGPGTSWQFTGFRHLRKVKQTILWKPQLQHHNFFLCIDWMLEKTCDAPTIAEKHMKLNTAHARSQRHTKDPVISVGPTNGPTLHELWHILDLEHESTRRWHCSMVLSSVMSEIVYLLLNILIQTLVTYPTSGCHS